MSSFEDKMKKMLKRKAETDGMLIIEHAQLFFARCSLSCCACAFSKTPAAAATTAATTTTMSMKRTAPSGAAKRKRSEPDKLNVSVVAGLPKRTLNRGKDGDFHCDVDGCDWAHKNTNAVHQHMHRHRLQRAAGNSAAADNEEDEVEEG